MNEPRANHRVAYFNGRIVPEREVVVPFRDRGFKYGDAAFDMTRTFHGRPFRLQDHVDRLYRSLRYLRIDPGLSPAEMVAASEQVLERNRHFLTPDTDYWLGQRVSRGVDAVGDEGWDHTGPNVIVECVPLPLKARARLFRDGIDIVVPPTRRVAPGWVLPGVSRAMVIGLCGELGIACREADLDLYDAATADEIFMTSTSLCLCPVRSIGGRVLPGPLPGLVTRQLSEAYAHEVGCDFVAQYLRHLS